MSTDVHAFTLVQAGLNRNDRELAMLTRSLLEILEELSADVDVPESHLASGEAPRTPPIQLESAERRIPRLLIRSAAERPERSFAAVSYNGYWFWIDAADLPSKRMLSFLSLLLTFTESGGQGAPVVTVPAGS